MPQQITNSC